MNIILLQDRDWIDSTTVSLQDYRAEHLTKVLRATEGQSLRVGLINGLKGLGTVLNVAGSEVRLRIQLTDPPSERHPLQLILALPRPKMLRRIFRSVAEFGVSELHLINSYRVEKSYWQSPFLDDSKVEMALVQGLERAGDTVLPKVYKHPRFKPFMEDQLPKVTEGRAVFIAHPGNHPALGCDESRGKRTVLVGPEGGFIDYEIDLAVAQGASPISLGNRILSVDTAVCAVLARGLRQ